MVKLFQGLGSAPLSWMGLSEVRVLAKATVNAVVSQRIEIAPGLIVLRVVPDGWELPDFQAGQFAVLGMPGSAPRFPGTDPDEKPIAPDKMIKRAYSISSASAAREYIEFYIALVNSGELTPRLFNLNIGDRLFLSPKCSGFFTLEEIPAEANIVLLSTGTGLAPYVSMVRSQLTHESRQRLAIIHGARHSWDLGYRDELVSIQRVSPALTYIPVVSRPAEEPAPWTGHTGYVQDIWNKRVVDEAWGFHPTPKDTHVFLCGNPSMIETVEVILKKEGFQEHKRKSPGQYHVERYW